MDEFHSRSARYTPAAICRIAHNSAVIRPRWQSQRKRGRQVSQCSSCYWHFIVAKCNHITQSICLAFRIFACCYLVAGALAAIIHDAPIRLWTGMLTPTHPGTLSPDSKTAVATGGAKAASTTLGSRRKFAPANANSSTFSAKVSAGVSEVLQVLYRALLIPSPRQPGLVANLLKVGQLVRCIRINSDA
jgi:hypothetical protein